MQSNSNFVRTFKKRENVNIRDAKRDKNSSKERYRKERRKKQREYE